MASEGMSVLLDSLTVGPWLRKELNQEHVVNLAELDGSWPPILVGRHDTAVIDGHHRVAAARLLGHTRIAAVLFDGTADDAYVEAVRRNVLHGLPLTLAERKAAAARLLSEHPEWSDRRIAGVCGISPHTVGHLRTELPAIEDGSRSRVGSDGRLRLVQPQANHQQILDAVRTSPDASLRKIARVVGTSPETVRRIRQRRDHGSPEPTGKNVKRSRNRINGYSAKAELAPLSSVTTLNASMAECSQRWVTDVALKSTSSGLRFATWFDGSNVDTCWQLYVGAVPLSRVYEVADEARRRGELWLEFARAVEERARDATPISRP
jgi:hypothetical protein